MTGSIHQLTRQHSSTTTSSKLDKSYLPKLRRYSSLDEHNSIASISDDGQVQEDFVFKRTTTMNDCDSGTEEIEQQMENIVLANTNDDEDQLSIKSFDPNHDEGFSECENQEETILARIQKDLELAQKIPDDMKKSFCSDTSVAFHAEFARLLAIPLSLHHKFRYYLFTEEELVHETNLNLIFDYRKVDNAKGQFKCPNIGCQHTWTSMRARISFLVSKPEIGLIVLKILGQDCELCGAYAHALWYIDEVCRVMKHLVKEVFECYFPDLNHP